MWGEWWGRRRSGSPDLLQARPRDDGCAVAIEGLRQLAPEPDAALFQVHLVRHVPHHRLPVRVEDEIARVAEQFHAIAPGLEAVEEVPLGDTVFPGPRLDAHIALTEDIGNVEEVLVGAV